jgi:hypothetical protein
MHSLPPAVLFNEETGRLELCHPEITRRLRRTQRLRSRYRSIVVRRFVIAAFKAPWRGAVALYGLAMTPRVTPARSTR